MESSHDAHMIQKYLSRYGWEEMFSPEVQSQIRLFSYDAGEYIIHQGTPYDFFYLYVEGKSKIVKFVENGKFILLRFYTPFQVMGDAELFNKSPSIGSMQALTEVKCLTLPTSVMHEEVKTNTKLLGYLCETLGRKLQSANVASTINQTYDVETRLASYLTGIYLDPCEGTQKEALWTDDLGDMADILGCSYRQLTRTMRVFREQGLISKRGKKIEILDERNLRLLARDLYS